MKQRTKNISIIVAVLLVAVVAVWASIFKPSKPPVSAPAGGQKAAVENTYTNERGEKWHLPTLGRYEYRVASSENLWPKFWQGFIDPLKVAPGIVQRMSVVVQSPAGIESVIAKIDTDSGTIEVPLKFSGIVTRREMKPEEYIVNSDGRLIVLSPLQIQLRYLSQIFQEEGWLGHIAQAQNEGQKEAWSGEWVVRDTSDRKYHTIFVARDKAGRENSLVMNWSDPCESGIPFAGNWTPPNGCTISVVTGVQNGVLNVSSQSGTLTIANDFAIGGSPAQASLNGGQISISDLPKGRILMGTILYMLDVDNDGYPPDINGTQYTSSGTYLRERRTLVQQNDCYDSNSNAHPGQYQFFTAHRGDGSYDYDCDGTTAFQYGPSNCTNLTMPNGYEGFRPMVYSCGSYGTYWVVDSWGTCVDTLWRQQGCR